MKKKLISLALLAGLILSSFTACGQSEEDVAATEEDTRTTTITLTAITGKSTTPEAIEAVQEAMNKLTKSEYKTQVILQLKTEDEYVEFIESQVELIEAEIAAEEEAAAKAKEEAKKKKEAEKAANCRFYAGSCSCWRRGDGGRGLHQAAAGGTGHRSDTAGQSHRLLQAEFV